MFRILQDSLLDPKGLLKQLKRSWFFVIMYLFVMALFMSLGTGSYLLSYESSTINQETTGCTLIDNQVTCTSDSNETLDTRFDILDIRVYILNTNQSVSDIETMESISLVIQGDTVGYYIEDSGVIGFKIFNESNNFQSLAEGAAYIENALLIFYLVSVVLSNVVLITIFALLATLMFSRFKNYMSWGRRFKLAVFGSTPIALVITFYNILNFSFLLFFILSIFAYRTFTVLNRHLYMELAKKTMNQQYRNQDYNQFDHDNVVDSYDPEDIYDDSDKD